MLSDKTDNSSPLAYEKSGDPCGEADDTVMVNRPDSPALRLWVVLARAHAALTAHVAADTARHGLSAAEFGVLEALYHRGPMLLGELQRKILVSSGGITFLVDRLAAKGLVERKACLTDRRARFAALTAPGRKLITRIFPEHQQAIERAVSGLSGVEQAEVAGLLRKLGLNAVELDMKLDVVHPPGVQPTGVKPD